MITLTLTIAGALEAFDDGARAAFKSILASVVVPDFVPKSGVKIETGEKKEEGAPEPQAAEEMSVVETTKSLLSKLPPIASLSGLKVTSLEFEKDDDTNFHMDYISSFANLRARNYSIDEVKHYVCMCIRST